ncbi:MAG: alpha/beta hydrolase [Thermoanaerobaculales bacterium]|jgi:pimeloyl-ACP methyl ester carboxylesterase|nr:alpha/beta hydrolase [Thermoanaerobaculales bacterium]
MRTRKPFIVVLTLMMIVTASGAVATDDSEPAITKHYVSVGGGQIHYATAGAGDVVLLLHQAPLSHAEFLATIPLLARHFKVVAWDAPGHGNSYIPDHEYDFPEYFRALEQFVDALGIERLSIVGNHSGAAFTREYAAAHPERVEKMILSGSARTPPEPKTTLHKADEFLSQPYSRELSLDPRGEFLPTTWQRYVTLAAPEADLDDVLAAFIIGLDARTKPYDMHLAIFGYEDWVEYRTIETPTMLLCGDGDIFVNSERLDYTCALFPNCEVHPLIENAGAFIGLEQPDAYAGAIIDFLTRP